MQQLFRLLIFFNQSYMFRATISPILRSTLFDCIYSFWYNALTLMPTGATVEMERQFHLNRGTGRRQCQCIVPKAVYTVKKSAPEDGRNCRPKHVGLIKKINKGKSCCIWLVNYIVVLVVHSHTNVKAILIFSAHIL